MDTKMFATFEVSTELLWKYCAAVGLKPENKNKKKKTEKVCYK